MKQYIAIIPARYASRRLPGKPLVRIHDKPLIQHVYERVSAALSPEHVYVATDHDEIRQVIEAIGGRVIMTSSVLSSGTDRVAAAYNAIVKERGPYDVILNIQGDMPLIATEYIYSLIHCFEGGAGVNFATLAHRVHNEEELNLPNDAFVVIDRMDMALYFSRRVIPFLFFSGRDLNPNFPVYRHIGVYGYTPDALRDFTRLEPGVLELSERLEQNRWLEDGRLIHVKVVRDGCPAVDVPEDIIRVEKIMSKERIKTSDI